MHTKINRCLHMKGVYSHINYDSILASTLKKKRRSKVSIVNRYNPSELVEIP